MDLIGKMATFVRVVEAGSFSSAAKQLRVSTAAVSRHVTTLEAAVGAALIARTTRRMAVTAAGQRYYERCLRVLRDVEDAQSVARTDLAGPIRISVPVTVGFLAGVTLLRPLLVEHPGIEISVRLEDRVVDLALDDVDVAIRLGSRLPLTTEIIAVPLSSWSRVVVASPDYVRRNGEPKTLAALSNHDALSTLGEAARDGWTLVGASAAPSRIRMRTRCSCNSGHMLRDLAVDGLGVALLPPWFVAEDLRRRRLVHLLRAWVSEPVAIHALYRASLRSENRVRVLVDHLRGAYARSGRTA